MFVRKCCACALGLFIVTACGEIDDPSNGSFYYDDVKILDTQETQYSLVDGTAEAVGVLAFVNDEATDFELLDINARLDRRAARGIIHHRNGPDLMYGTWDDEPFESIEALDSVKWVGGAAIANLIEYASVQGWVPSGRDQLGVYDGISFTVTEAQATVEFVNRCRLDELDSLLNRRAAVSIYENGPYVSIHEVASVRYVGRASMRILKRDDASTPIQK